MRQESKIFKIFFAGSIGITGGPAEIFGCMFYIISNFLLYRVNFK